MSPKVQIYKPVVRARSGNYHAAALVGTNTAIIGWNMASNISRTGLLGFAIRRTQFDAESGSEIRRDWLYGQKRFRCMEDDYGLDVRSNVAPFQRFRWSDYTLSPDYTYLFEIYPMFGKPCDLKPKKPIKLPIKPSNGYSDNLGIYTNRGVTAAQAYLSRFGNQSPSEVQNDAAHRWLSRGLKESLLNFIKRAGQGDELHVAIYEFHDEEVARALKTAQGNCDGIRIVYHCPDPNQKTVIENEQLLRKVGLKNVAKARTNAAISHNKFVVLMRGGQAIAVWTGSANFTEAGFYLQTNVGLVIDHKLTAEAYEKYFQILLLDETRERKKAGRVAVQDRVEDLIDASNNVLNGNPWDVLFSPVRSEHIVDAAIELIKKAKTAILVSAPFALDRRIVTALGANSDDVLEYGLSNATAKKKIATLNRRNTRFFIPTRLKTYMGRTWDAKAFGSHKIHSKLLIVDPWSETPAVLVGSSNFSKPSCRNNDENALLADSHKRNQRLAAMLATEFLRMFDHYKSRSFINSFYSSTAQQNRYLEDDGSWSNTAFKKDSPSHKYRDREVFAGLQ